MIDIYIINALNVLFLVQLKDQIALVPTHQPTLLNLKLVEL